MPLLSTIGTLSSRGFGQLNGGKPLVLNTYTFPAGTSTFTVPATTNLLLSAVGAGADGTPGSSQNVPASRSVVYPITKNAGSPITGGTSETYDTYITLLNNVVAAVNIGGTVYFTSKGVTVGTNNLCSVNSSNQDISNVIAGSATGNIYPSSLPRTGAITYANAPPSTAPGSLSVQYTYTRTIAPTTGASTTGFGLTFPGGAGGSSSTTTFTNVAVTPNQIYTIQNNKSLTITYYA